MPVLLSIHLLLKWTLHCNLFIDLSLVRDGRERKWNVWMECFDPTPFCFWILCNKTVFALLIAFLLYTVLATCVHFYRQKVQKVLNLTVFYGFSPISFFFFISFLCSIRCVKFISFQLLKIVWRTEKQSSNDYLPNNIPLIFFFQWNGFIKT